MSIAGHGRRLDRLERRGRAAEGRDLAKALQQARQRTNAVHAVVDFVQALAGTGKSEAAPAPPAGERATHPVPRPPSPPRGKRPSEDPVSRPHRNAVLTWDELMRLGWQVETPLTELGLPTPAEETEQILPVQRIDLQP